MTPIRVRAASLAKAVLAQRIDEPTALELRRLAVAIAGALETYEARIALGARMTRSLERGYLDDYLNAKAQLAGVARKDVEITPEEVQIAITRTGSPHSRMQYQSLLKRLVGPSR